MKRYDVINDVDSIRSYFPILSRSVYLISNSLGAVPRQPLNGLRRYY
ncbi:MAG: hypothetical protein ACOC57_01060 [Acidobacteriota bacterium]